MLSIPGTMGNGVAPISKKGRQPHNSNISLAGTRRLMQNKFGGEQPINIRNGYVFHNAKKDIFV